VPRVKVNAGVAWQLGPQTRLSGVARYVGTQYYDNDQENTFHKMPAYTVVDLKFTQTIDRLTLGLAINNLLNKLYYSYAIKSTFGPPTFSAYPQADQTFLLTADYRF
jgi:iron complex outermembrane receptor protein